MFWSGVLVQGTTHNIVVLVIIFVTKMWFRLLRKRSGKQPFILFSVLWLINTSNFPFCTCCLLNTFVSLIFRDWMWYICVYVCVFFRKRKREEGDDLNHIPMLLLGYLTERRRHHWRHNYMTLPVISLIFAWWMGKNDWRWWYIQRQRFLSWLLMQHRIESSSWALSGAPIFFCHPSVVTPPPPLLNNSFYQLWSVHLWLEEKQKVKETGTASWNFVYFDQFRVKNGFTPLAKLE